ncbi:MarR family transcriptional regulator [Streptomyces cocklensis]|uniref:DNA-binding transcriptional regulator, MarR family n=1 Tax=Actinacidiphila cocklensis TaxID=887465 RepID=A0A9W4DYS5_9ACTN|nr:MarR family transcriptional regulator [Actinacidiphila cocklensis]MDD1061134.1 MarR family transcriptional regulator [Actinacidiphila cocklensis]CAG6398631.1 DNA-binding transcriptional regulator, MarR family [Actinacidiphila cocklensis]
MPATPRRDLAAMIVPLGRALTAAELPLLHDHGLTMWAYSVLLRLDDRPLRSQAALAEAIGADKTRIIDVLADLEERGLISRTSDPADRRVRLLALTPEGHRVRTAAQSAIQSREDRLLARHLTPAQRTTFLEALATLSTLPPDTLTTP